MHTCTLSCTLSIDLLVEKSTNLLYAWKYVSTFSHCFQRIIRRNEWFSVIEKVKPFHAIKCAWHTNVYLNESLSIQSFTIVKNLLRSMSIIIHNVHRSKSWIWKGIYPVIPVHVLVFQSSHWVGTVLLNTCRIIERPSKKDGFCFKLFHPLDQSIWATKVRARVFTSISKAFEKHTNSTRMNFI